MYNSSMLYDAARGIYSKFIVGVNDRNTGLTPSRSSNSATPNRSRDMEIMGIANNHNHSCYSINLYCLCYNPAILHPYSDINRDSGSNFVEC
jgi:hypothetical protein